MTHIYGEVTHIYRPVTHIYGAAHERLALVCLEHNLEKVGGRFVAEIKHFRNTPREILHSLACRTTLQRLIGPIQSKEGINKSNQIAVLLQ